MSNRAPRTILKNLLSNNGQKGWRLETCTRNQETKKLIIILKDWFGENKIFFQRVLSNSPSKNKPNDIMHLT